MDRLLYRLEAEVTFLDLKLKLRDNWINPLRKAKKENIGLFNWQKGQMKSFQFM